MKIKHLLLASLIPISLASCDIIFPWQSNETPITSPSISESETKTESISESSLLTESLSESISESLSESFSESISESVTESLTESFSESTSENPVESKAKNILNFLYDGEIPMVNINTDDKADIDSKEDYTSGKVSITTQGSEKKELLEAKKAGIRLRGNSTLACPKKAYRIKFDKKQSLFGLPKAKSWVLLANYFDKSNVRNYLAYLLANKLSNLAFQPSSIFVEVTVNGDYQGLYLLCEQMQTGEGRVDIESIEPSNNEYAFMVERNDISRLDITKLDQEFIYAIDSYYEIKYPDTESISKEQVDFVREKMVEYKNAITTGQDLNNIINIPSFIDSYFIQELFKNVDVGDTSMYYYYTPNGELMAGPVWDFDIGLDAVGINGNLQEYSFYQYATLYAIRAPEYAILYANCHEEMMERYTKIRDILLTVYDELEIVSKALSNAQARNVAKWSLPGDPSGWVGARLKAEYNALTTVDAHYQYVKDKLDQRFAILDDEYLLDK